MNFQNLLQSRWGSSAFRGSRFPARALRSGQKAAFSLIEVVMALGICTFVLVSMVGLLSVSMDLSRESMEVSQKSKMAQRIVNELQQSKFDELATLGGTKQWAFDFDGTLLPTVTDAKAHYLATATLNRSLTLPGSTSTLTNLFRVKLAITTPMQKKYGSRAEENLVITIPYTGYGTL